jgi:hypothetical protein
MMKNRKPAKLRTDIRNMYVCAVILAAAIVFVSPAGEISSADGIRANRGNSPERIRFRALLFSARAVS